MSYLLKDVSLEDITHLVDGWRKRVEAEKVTIRNWEERISYVEEYLRNNEDNSKGMNLKLLNLYNENLDVDIENHIDSVNTYNTYKTELDRRTF